MLSAPVRLLCINENATYYQNLCFGSEWAAARERWTSNILMVDYWWHPRFLSNESRNHRVSHRKEGFWIALSNVEFTCGAPGSTTQHNRCLWHQQIPSSCREPSGCHTEIACQRAKSTKKRVSCWGMRKTKVREKLEASWKSSGTQGSGQTQAHACVYIKINQHLMA